MQADSFAQQGHGISYAPLATRLILWATRLGAILLATVPSHFALHKRIVTKDLGAYE